jgi:hypothetical protein
MTTFKPPKFKENSFNCPHCNAFANQRWYDVFTNEFITDYKLDSVSIIKLSVCDCCNKYSVWYDGKIVFPDTPPVPIPNDDMPEEIKDIYNEARAIVTRSQKGAAALLRLAVEKFCIHLKADGKDLNEKIANLVKKGLPEKIQKALDIVRVIGNNAVHPGQIDLDDNPEFAHELFDLINIITDYMITQPKKVDAVYSKLPDNQKETIKKRNEKNTEGKEEI